MLPVTDQFNMEYVGTVQSINYNIVYKYINVPCMSV